MPLCIVLFYDIMYDSNEADSGEILPQNLHSVSADNPISNEFRVPPIDPILACKEVIPMTTL